MLKVLVMQKKRTALAAKLTQLRSQRETLRGEEKTLRERLDAMPDTATAEELRAISDEVDANTAAQTRCDDEIAATLDEMDKVDADIEAAQAGAPAGEEFVSERGAEGAANRRAAAPSTATADAGSFRSRSMCFTTRAQRDTFFARDDVHDFLARVRGMVGTQKRGVTGAELTIPETVLDLIRDNLTKYSKLVNLVRLRSVSGVSRQQIVGDIPEGVWMEMKGALNELTFELNELETDGFKVGGVIIIDNYLLEDSDIALGEEILYMIGQSIGYALDKAIVYGKGSASKMPVGIVTRLAQTSQPSYWGPNQGTWTDLHSSNILKLNLAALDSGIPFFQPLFATLSKAKPKFSAGRTVWIMNHTTHMDLISRCLSFNASGALVAGMNNTMPVEGGTIVELEFMPDYEIVGGYLDLYLLAERSGGKFGYSDLPLYIADKTVFKGTARYDGQPVRGEAFIAVNYNNTEVTTDVSFAADYANTEMNVLICTAAASATASGKTVVTVAGTKAESATLKYAKQFGGALAVGDKLGTGWTALTSGTTEIEAAAGTPITVAELDGDNRVVSVGTVTSVPKA